MSQQSTQIDFNALDSLFANLLAMAQAGKQLRAQASDIYECAASLPAAVDDSYGKSRSRCMELACNLQKVSVEAKDLLEEISPLHAYCQAQLKAQQAKDQAKADQAQAGQAQTAAPEGKEQANVQAQAAKQV